MSLSPVGAALNGLSVVIGLTLIVGASRRWSWLVDPPERLWPYYSQALLKRIFGVRFVIVFTHLVGLTMIGAPLVAVWFR